MQYTPSEEEGGDVGFDYDDPDILLKELGMTPEQEVMLTTVLTNELKNHLAKEKKIPIWEVELRMTHVKDVEVNYDYLTELIEQLLNQVHEGKKEAAKETKEEIQKFANSLEDRTYAEKIVTAAQAIYQGHYPTADSNFTYPARLSESQTIIQEANAVSLNRVFLDFRNQWGITDIVTNQGLRSLFANHRYEQKDMDDSGQLRDIIAQASLTYQEMAMDSKIQTLSRIKYRNGLREAIYQLADQMVERL
ncbi:Type I restriction-modification system, restriction subunit R [Streptococcus sp. DD12]|nr:Type I restriction-modification system, restriction subunit R [Streptococcus sp. DD12]